MPTIPQVSLRVLDRAESPAERQYIDFMVNTRARLEEALSSNKETLLHGTGLLEPGALKLIEKALIRHGWKVRVVGSFIYVTSN